MQADEGNSKKMIGFGTFLQDGALRLAGASTIFSPVDLDFIAKHAAVVIRPGYTWMMTQPNLIRLSFMRAIIPLDVDCPVLLLVPGHKPIPYTSDAALLQFRAQKPAVTAPMTANRGRPNAILYTPKQADAIIREWHAVPRRKRSEVVETAARIMCVDTLKASWVRDLVIKFVGTAQRDRPADWTGLNTET